MPADIRVCVIGIWHLGAVTSACLAHLGHQVTGVDKDASKVEALNRGNPPIFESGLQELTISQLNSRRLTYTTDLRKAVKNSNFVLLTIDTPVNEKDEVDLTEIFDMTEELSRCLRNGSIVIVNSQVPVGTCEQLKASIKKLNPFLDFDIAYNPENLRLGQALERFINPEIIIIGAETESTFEKIEAFLSVIKAPTMRMNIRTAEMTKHALNAFLATSISFANELGNLCDEIGVDGCQIAQTLGADKRIGPMLPLHPGLAFSGGTLARDLKILQTLGRRVSHETYLIDSVIKVNEQQNRQVIKKLTKIYGSITNLTVGILGLVYKAGTSTLRRSASLEIIGQLTRSGASIKAYDPKADLGEVQSHPGFIFYSDPYQVAEDSDALIVLTNWPEFRELNFELIKSKMKRPVLIDAINMLDKKQRIAEGFNYLGIGTGIVYGIKR